MPPHCEDALPGMPGERRRPRDVRRPQGRIRARGRGGFSAGSLASPPQASACFRYIAPGRSEIAGNHTDHEGGHVIAGALDVAVNALARPNGLGVVRLASDGYPTIEVSLDSLDPQDAEKNTTASLVRGMAFGLAQDGRTPAGFDLAMTSTIPVGGGLSSSAAVRGSAGTCDGGPLGGTQL